MLKVVVFGVKGFTERDLQLRPDGKQSKCKDRIN
jgi:hypothetical protein